MIKNKIDAIVNNYFERESKNVGNDFVEDFTIFNILKVNYDDTLTFLKSATVDEIEIISHIVKELVNYFKSQELLDVFKKFEGCDFKYLCTDSYDEDVEDAQYILDNNIQIPIPNPDWL